MYKNITKRNTGAYANKQESMVCIITCLVIMANSIITLFNGTIRSFVILPYKLDTVFIYGIIVFTVFYSAKTILNRATILIYIIIAFLLLEYLMAFIINSYHCDYYTKLGIDIFLHSLPCLFVTYAVRDNKLLKRYLYFSALIIMVAYLLNLYVFKIDMLGNGSYDQFYTYQLLPVSIIILNNLFNKIKMIDVIIFIISIILMLSMGARGPLMCVALYVVLKIILLYRFKIKKTFLINITLLSIIIPLYTKLYDILSYIFRIFQSMNLSTRTVIRLMEGTFLQDIERNLLKQYSISIIKEHPLIGVGIGKDRILLSDKIASTDILTEVIGWYPHNIFLEILLHFGIIIGGVIIIYMLKVLYITTFKNMDKDATDVICIFIGIGIFPLLVSGSYITSPLFFALMGLCLYQYKNIKVNKKVINSNCSL